MLPYLFPIVRFLLLFLLLGACSESDPTSPGPSFSTSGAAGQPIEPTPDATGQGGAADQGGTAGQGEAGTSQDPIPFAVAVVSFLPGPGAGFGQENMPDVVLGPPEGGGETQGSLDVVSLGSEGEIVLRLGVDAIDEPGPDLLVFENPFFVGGDPEKVWKELGEVSVSEDGETWATFTCDPTHFKTTSCAGWRPVLASSSSGISPLEPETAGGDPFDLAEVGIQRARYVRIRDLSQIMAPPTAGFDLDAVAVIHTAP
ncbi:MAG: cell surface protein [Myxococcales bacterium]|nr:cell surface protein [Polyangiaceae bacterium]MDW8250593.1 cell surface protein [Myxococcales bacterium]